MNKKIKTLIKILAAIIFIVMFGISVLFNQQVTGRILIAILAIIEVVLYIILDNFLE